MPEVITAALEAQLAALRRSIAERGPELAALHERLFAELREQGQPRAPGIGERAPDFDLRIARNNRPLRMSHMLDVGAVVLCFYRGHWCPFSNVQLQALEASHEAIRSSGAEVLSVGPETPANARKMAEKWAATVPVLYDSAGDAMDAYGISFDIPDYLRADYVSLGFPAMNAVTGWRLPIPATFVIDRLGVVRARHIDPDHTRRMEPADIVAALRKLTTR
jgi:peroxiredoxin